VDCGFLVTLPRIPFSYSNADTRIARDVIIAVQEHLENFAHRGWWIED
jgi:hypothetical protein